MQRASSSLLRLRTITRPATRSYSAGTYNSVEDIQKEMNMWRNVAFLGLIGVSFLYYVNIEDEEAVHPQTFDMTCTHIKHKPYPWKNAPSKSLFDFTK